MKKKYALSFLLVLSVLLSISASAFAWQPDSSFQCSTDPRKMPENTVYIDLLLPIGTEDEGYVPFNQANGEKYGISPDSEIVRYNKGGYVSYTFHMTDADSQMRPYYSCNFLIPLPVYAKYWDQLKTFGSDSAFVSDDQNQNCWIKLAYGDSREDLIRAIAAEPDVVNDTHFKWDELVFTEYNESYFRKSDFDLDYCCRQYRYAKMAYLDKEGNILGVSSAARIKPHAVLNLSLSGRTFRSAPETTAPIFRLVLFLVIITVMFVVRLIALIAVVIVWQIKKRQERAKAPTDK